jgi:DNA repair exonuclease SbcCD ATPase subunit
MSQMQRPYPYDAPHKGSGGEPPDPNERLNQLKIELDQQKARLEHLGKEKDDLQSDIDELEKTVADVKTTLTDYAAKFKDLETRLHSLQYFYEQKHKMIMAAIGEKKGPIDELIREFDYELERMQERLAELGENLAEATEESHKADGVQAAKQAEYDIVKGYTQDTLNKLNDMDSLRTAITQADDATDVASMYFEVLEFHSVLSGTNIISQHQLALELKQRLGELEAAKEHARAKSAAMNNLQTEYKAHQATLKAKRDGRRQALLAAVQALFPVPAAHAAAATSGSAAPASNTGTGSQPAQKK